MTCLLVANPTACPTGQAAPVAAPVKLGPDDEPPASEASIRPKTPKGLVSPKITINPLAVNASHQRSVSHQEDRVTHYGYRYMDPVTGRWPSRDPIEEAGGVNLYGFVGNDGVNRWDILGLAETFGVTHVKNQPTCGGVSSIFLDFKLDKQSPSGGFFVQQNDVTKSSTDCIGGSQQSTSDQFWESFMVPANQDRFVGASYVPTKQKPQPIYSDQSNTSIPDWTCGSKVVIKTMKFFSSATTGNLGWPAIPGVTPGQNPTAPGWQITPGLPPAGNLPWTRNKPNWWGNPSHEIKLKITVKWTCCTVKSVTSDVEVLP